MEIIKDLPEVFEEFAEQRQKSFLAVKQLKDKGIPVIGSYCTYFPKEIAMAMGAATVSLCSTSEETIPAAEKDLPRNLCPLIKSSYGFAKTDKCPFFYFSDVVAVFYCQQPEKGGFPGSLTAHQTEHDFKFTAGAKPLFRQTPGPEVVVTARAQIGRAHV